jgi:hypothetical protein
LPKLSGLLAFPILVLVAAAARADTPSALAAPAPRERAIWQQRRDDFFRVMRGVQANDANAFKELDAILSDYDAHPLGRTPMENMDVLGAVYVPRDGAEKLFPVVVMNAVLGWYDVLRYASDSGRQVIVGDDKFFVRAFALGGPEVYRHSMAFIRENPERVAALVEEGIRQAEQYRHQVNYDQTWPADYGTTEGAVIPEEAWDSAWAKAEAQVRSYYIVHPKPAEAAPPAAGK